MSMEVAPLRVGLIGESVQTVTAADCANQMGSGSLEVFATPIMIALMEAAAVSAVDAQLPAEQASVGIHIDVRHISATPVGERVTAMAEVTHIEGRRVTLQVRAWDDHELIGEGTHIRYIIDIDHFMSRLPH
ncbi:thioesterase family protein [Phototrophicus methaneseepsis]|nr:thioesterase family protein [Phototrophicus methaneseepsis]